MRRARSGLAHALALACLAVSPAAATPVIGVPQGAVWNYLAGPAAPAAGWQAIAFDDAPWPAGAAPLGYGETSIVTPVPYGPSASDKWPATYFRTVFEVGEDPATLLHLTLDANYDDGFVAYLNGVEVARASMPAGPVEYATRASSHESGVFERFDLSADVGLLVNGPNVLAVEVHQTSAGSSDLVLDMQLSWSSDPVSVTRGPYLQVGTPTAITVRWRTDAACVGVVRYGLAPGAEDLSAAESGSGTEHMVTLAGLTPATRYWYSIGTPAAVLAAGADYTFRSAPVAGSPAPVRFWAIGDAGLGNQNARNVYAAYRAFPGAAETDLWLMLGDNAYTSGTDAEYQAGVFDVYPELLRQSALFPTRGNHDLLYAGVANDYYDIFTLPADGAAGGLASGSEAYYSFDRGSVHFVCLDSEGSDRGPAGPMLEWLRADLAATARPWIVAYWHHPPYTRGSHDSDDPNDSGGRMRDMRENVLPILDSTGVDLVLSGHSHAYERSFLLNGHYGVSSTLTEAMKIDPGDGRADGDGAYRKPDAMHGAFEGAVYTVAGSSAQTGGGPLDHPVMVTSLNELGSLVVDVEGTRMQVRFLDDAGVVRDSFAIVKGALAATPPLPAAATLHLAARPNPASGPSRLEFDLPAAGRARLTVLDVGGRRVATLVDGRQPAGRHTVSWNGLDSRGRRMAPGVYYAVLEQAGDVRAVPLVRMD